jgi:hypothetical protein
VAFSSSITRTFSISCLTVPEFLRFVPFPFDQSFVRSSRCKADLEGGALRFLAREMNLAPVILDDTAGDLQPQPHC